VATSGTVATPESQRLRTKIALWLPELTKASRRFVDHPRVRDLYPEYLETMHGIVRASVPLMETARTRSLELSGRDAVAAAVAEYFDKHIDEEIGHDEWLLEDLEALGRERAGVLGRPPSPAVAAVIGAQYYWILHVHPVALLGYTMLLEGYAPVPADVDDLMARTGYGADSFRTMSGHAELDPGHADELAETIDSLPLSAAQSAVLGLSAMSTVHGLARVLDDMVDTRDGAAR
jgi:Iron-containing redox enzyme